MKSNHGKVVFCLVLALVVSMCGAAHAFAPYAALYGDTLGGLGGVCHTRCDVFTPAPYTSVEVWVWFLPDPAKGMAAGEFRILYPTSTYVFQGPVTSNPLNQVELGTLGSGMSFSIGGMNCQYGWYWSHWQEIVVWNLTPRIIQIAGHPGNGGHIYVASCEPGFPAYDATILSHFMLNQSCVCALGSMRLCNTMQGLSSVGGVIYTDFTALEVYFDEPPLHDCTVKPYEDNFLLRSTSLPPDTILVTHAVKADVGRYDLTLESNMVHGTTYVLEARNICSCESCSPSCENSSFEFTFQAAIGTTLKSSSVALAEPGVEIAWELSEVDRRVEFFVSRSENGGDYRTLDGAALTRDGLKFVYVDRSVEPGRKYSYKVEYGVGAPSKLLFISEAISTPAMPLTLYQNKPNPFNPSTMISFYLPVEASVRLEIYDISGRLVDRLIGGERRIAGTHNIEWNGRDSQGSAVSSGIYFYRLSVSKETISKKIVLLR